MPLSHKVYVPGIAFSDGRGTEFPTLWTAIFYQLNGGAFDEYRFRKSGATVGERDDPHPQAGLARIISSIRQGDEIFVLLFDCPSCATVSEFDLSRPHNTCQGCGSRWDTGNAVLEMAFENVPWDAAKNTLRNRMDELANGLGILVGKTLF